MAPYWFRISSSINHAPVRDCWLQRIQCTLGDIDQSRTHLIARGPDAHQSPRTSKYGPGTVSSSPFNLALGFNAFLFTNHTIPTEIDPAWAASYQLRIHEQEITVYLWHWGRPHLRRDQGETSPMKPPVFSMSQEFLYWWSYQDYYLAI